MWSESALPKPCGQSVILYSEIAIGTGKRIRLKSRVDEPTPDGRPPAFCGTAQEVVIEVDGGNTDSFPLPTPSETFNCEVISQSANRFKP